MPRTSGTMTCGMRHSAVSRENLAPDFLGRASRQESVERRFGRGTLDRDSSRVIWGLAYSDHDRWSVTMCAELFCYRIKLCRQWQKSSVGRRLMCRASLNKSPGTEVSHANAHRDLIQFAMTFSWLTMDNKICFPQRMVYKERANQGRIP